MKKSKKTILVTAAAVGMLMLGGGAAQAEPAPPPPSPAPGLSPEAAQAYQRQWELGQSYPCGLSIQPDPIPHLVFKQC
jgi:hypothetical protein